LPGCGVHGKNSVAVPERLADEVNSSMGGIERRGLSGKEQ
jgi:hypothetical protein